VFEAEVREAQSERKASTSEVPSAITSSGSEERVASALASSTKLSGERSVSEGEMDERKGVKTNHLVHRNLLDHLLYVERANHDEEHQQPTHTNGRVLESLL